MGRQPQKLSKHQEPHGWQRVATYAQGRRGESRQGGGKPWRRNEDRRWFRLTRSRISDGAAGVDSSAAYGGGAIFGNPRRGIRQGLARRFRRRRWSRRKRRRQVQEGPGHLFESSDANPVMGPRRGNREDRRQPQGGRQQRPRSCNLHRLRFVAVPAGAPHLEARVGVMTTGGDAGRSL